MSIELPEVIRQTIAPFATGCWALQCEGKTAIILKAPSEEVDSLWNAPIGFRFEFTRLPGSAGVCLHLDIGGPSALSLETVWDVGEENQRHDLDSLTGQDYFDLHFFNSDTNYIFTRRIPLEEEQRRLLAMTITQARVYREGVVEQQKDWAKVKAHFTVEED